MNFILYNSKTSKINLIAFVVLCASVFMILALLSCDIEVSSSSDPGSQDQPVYNLNALTYANTNTLYASWSLSSSQSLSTSNSVQYYLLEITKTSLDANESNPIISERIYDSTITSFSTGLTAGEYKVEITVVNADGTKSTVVKSNAITIVTEATPATVVNPTTQTLVSTINGNTASLTIPIPAITATGKAHDGATAATIVSYTVYTKQGSTVAINDFEKSTTITKTQVDTNQNPILDFLSPDTTYAVRIAALNSAGIVSVGTVFTIKTAAITGSATAPDAPQNVKAIASVVTDQITVSWDAPLSAGLKTDNTADSISKYKVYWQQITATTPTASRNSKDFKEITGTSGTPPITTTIITTNIDVTKSYSIIVVAENTGMLYAISNAVKTIPAPTDKATPITAVTFDSIQANDITKDSITVRFTTDIAGARTPQGQALTNNQVKFKIYYAPQPSPAYTTVAQVIAAATAKGTIQNIAAVATTTDAIPNSANITGLNIGTTYQIVVQAINTSALTLITNSTIGQYHIILDLDQVTINYDKVVAYVSETTRISPTLNVVFSNSNNALTYSIAHKSGSTTAATVSIDKQSGVIQINNATTIHTTTIMYTVTVTPTAIKATGATKTIDFTILGIDLADCSFTIPKNGDVYEISIPRHLLASTITGTGLDKKYSVINDITLPSSANVNCYSYVDTDNKIKFGNTTQRTLSFTNFEPIGNATNKFTGSFNGNNHTISGLTINKTSQDYIGLFGYVENATIQNLLIDNANIQGKDYVGALVGYVKKSTITNVGVKNTGNLTISSSGSNVGGLAGYVIDSSTVNGFATQAVSASWYVGGLVGYVNDSTVSGYATGTVTGTGVYVGGLAGHIFSSTVSGYALGAVSGGGGNVGGLAGYGSNSTINGYARNTVTRSAGNKSSFGFLVGSGNAAGYHSRTESMLVDVSDADGLSGSEIPMNAQTTKSDFSKLIFGSDIGQFTWVADGQWPAINIGSISPAAEQMTARVGNADNRCISVTTNRPTLNNGVYEISTEAQLLWINNCLAGSYILKNNITLTNTDWTPIGSLAKRFTGSFDGKTFTISQLEISKSTIDYIGLFSYIENATIKNLVIDHAGIQGKDYVGALTGNASYSTVTNVSMKSTNNSTVSGINFVGGLLGKVTSSTISGYTSGKVSGSDSVGGLAGELKGSSVRGYAIGNVSGAELVGGFAGITSFSTVSGFAKGDVNATGSYGYAGGFIGYVSENSIATGYATGTVTTANTEAGGFAGRVRDATAKGYATGDVKGKNYVGGLVGRILGYGSEPVVTGYTRGTVTRSSGADTSFGKLSGFYQSFFSINTPNFGYHSATESTLIGIPSDDAIGEDGTAITMASDISKTDFDDLFSNNVDTWSWVANGKWPAINIGDFDTLFGISVNGDDPSEQPVDPKNNKK